MSSVKKLIGGEECECFEVGDTHMMRFQLSGTFGTDVNRETLMLVPGCLSERVLDCIADLWLTEQEKELGLSAGESCSSNSWWLGSDDTTHDADITTKYDCLVNTALKTMFSLDETTWICVYKDTLGYSDDYDNLTDILVPTDWLLNALSEENMDLDFYQNESTADHNENIARKAMQDEVILDCDNDFIKSRLVKTTKPALVDQIGNAVSRASVSSPQQENGLEPQR